MRKCLLATLPLIFLSATPPLRAAGAASAPASASVKDFSTPTAAVTSYLQASYNQLDLSVPQDDAAITNTLIIPDAQKQTILAELALTSAAAKLERACADYFGIAATRTALHDSGRDLLAARLKTIASAPVTVTGDTATIQIPADPSTRAAAGTVVLHRVNGQWKIDAASLFSLSGRTAEQLAKQTDLFKKITDTTNQITLGVHAKKYASPADVYADLQTGIAKELSAAAPATSPAPKQLPR